MPSYCAASLGHPVHGPYHDTVHGYPTRDEADLFERLTMEINQAGLSWLTILNKRQGLQDAFAQFDVDKVAAFNEKDFDRLMNDASIIRNRLKIRAVIHNANVIQDMRQSHGGFAKWIDAHHPLTKEEWVKLFKKTFKFTGGEIVNEFLMSTGYLPGAHDADCPIYKKIAKMKPAWMKAG